MQFFIFLGFLLFLVTETRVLAKEYGSINEVNSDSGNQIIQTTLRSQPEPPPKNETARMARYIVHYSGKLQTVEL